MAAIASVPGLKNHMQAAPKEVRDYFQFLPGLLDAFPLEVSLAYAFSRVELAHNMMLYCGVVKCHRADAELTRKSIDVHHMIREDFRKKAEIIFGKPLPEKALESLEAAERIRDRVMHGKDTPDRNIRQAIGDVIDWAVQLNAHLSKHAGLKPFGDLRGFKGAAKSLDKSTTRWILKGMGFPVS